MLHVGRTAPQASITGVFTETSFAGVRDVRRAGRFRCHAARARLLGGSLRPQPEPIHVASRHFRHRKLIAGMPAVRDLTLEPFEHGLQLGVLQLKFANKLAAQ